MTAFTSLRQKIEWSRAHSQGFTSYLASHQVRKLQLGAGSNVLDGWFNTDIIPSTPNVFFLDSTKHFSFDDATFHYVFSEHHIEHITYSEGLVTLRECYRILKPGGKIRLATPSLEALMGLYTMNLSDLQHRYIRFIMNTFLPEIRVYNVAFVINNAFHNWGHQFLYDRATLQNVMEEVGFVDITFTTPSVSTDEQLRGIEKHGQFIGNEEMNQFETMVVEGMHPL